MATFTPLRRLPLLPLAAKLGTPYALPSDALCIRCSELIVKLSTTPPIRTSEEMTERRYYDLGTMAELANQQTCKVCNLVAHISSPHVKSSRDLVALFWDPTRTEHRGGMNDVELQLRVAGDLKGEIGRLSSIIRLFPLAASGSQSEQGRAMLCDCCSHPKRLCSKSDGRIDFEAVRLWLQDCVSNHRKCHPDLSDGHSTSTFQCPSMLIDVSQQCLVPAPAAATYCAISYVYGDCNTFRTRKSNLGTLQQRGGLCTAYSDLPAVIIDAITLTAAIGERYLWVDSLCITHDDDQDLLDQIDHMNDIYSQAVITFIALSGSSADDPLPGIRHSSRDSLPTTTLWHDTLFLDPPPPGYQLYMSQYDTRAWTLQEHLLSVRCLFITKFEVYFFCRERGHRELMWSIDESKFHAANGASCNDLRYVLNHERENFAMNPLFNSKYIVWEEQPTLASYLDVARRYSQRVLSKEDDIVRAFAGLQGILGRDMSTNFISGLPRSHIILALHWIPGEAGNRHGDNFESIETLRQHLRRQNFPSFSWTGWYGAIEWLEAVGNSRRWQYRPRIDIDTDGVVSQDRLRIRKGVLAQFIGLSIHTSNLQVAASGVNFAHEGTGLTLRLHKILDTRGFWCGRLCERYVPLHSPHAERLASLELKLLLLSQCAANTVIIRPENGFKGEMGFPFDHTEFAAHESEHDNEEAQLCNLLLIASALDATGTPIPGTFERVSLLQIHKTVWDTLEKEEREIYLV